MSAYDHTQTRGWNAVEAVIRYELRYGFNLNMAEYNAAIRVYMAASLNTPQLQRDLSLLSALPGGSDFPWIGYHGLRYNW